MKMEGKHSLVQSTFKFHPGNHHLLLFNILIKKIDCTYFLQNNFKKTFKFYNGVWWEKYQ